jgi:hypothetical protein
MGDEHARQLADLEVKRNRTLADLEAVQAAVQSVRKAMGAHPARQTELNQRFIDRLEDDALPESERQQLYREWGTALQNNLAGYHELVEEREQLHMQELVLVRMVVELDHRITVLREALGGRE